MNNLFKKLNLLPNSGLFEIWLQRITMPNSIKIDYKDGLCKKIENNSIQIFNTSWINNLGCKHIIEKAEYIDYTILNSIDSVIKSEEIEIYKNDYYP